MALAKGNVQDFDYLNGMVKNFRRKVAANDLEQAKEYLMEITGVSNAIMDRQFGDDWSYRDEA